MNGPIHSTEVNVRGGIFAMPFPAMWMVLLTMLNWGMVGQTTYAQDRPIKEFFITVKETTMTLLKDPKKTVTVWAYALQGQTPSVPGPVIRVTRGDLVKVHFSNTHTLPHTIHFHGVHPFNMDENGQRALGEEQLQMPGESYMYKWVAEDPGFYFYHCHFNTAQHLDHGMCGLFIVEDPAWPQVDREILTIWDEWDTNGDGQYDTHTINSRSAPDFIPLKATVGERIRIILANIGFEFHTPHLHGQKWTEVNAGNLRSPVSENPNGVVSIGPAEIKVVEFVPKHNGTWLFHCHVVPHVADDGTYPRGMLTVLQVEETGTMIPDRADTNTLSEGTGPDMSPSAETTSVQPVLPTKFPEGLAKDGYDVYNTHCKSCHSDFARGEYGPKLQQNPVLHDNNSFWNTVLNGRGNMPAWSDRLSVQQIADVQAYLQTLKPAPPP